MIHETIVTTLGADGHAHLAPMGVREAAGLVVLAPFRPSATLTNLLTRRHAVVNFTDDVRVFAGCLCGRRDWPMVPASAGSTPRLENALVHWEVELERIEDDPQRPRLLCRRLCEQNHAPFRGFNRAQAAVIEAAILVSRLHLLPRQKIDAELAYLSIAIDKTAGPHEREAWEWLMARIATFRAEAAS